MKATQEVLPPQTFLIPHSNPMNLERSSENKVINYDCIGFESIIEDLHQDLNDYFRKDKTGPYIAMIKGEIGSGKTALALNLIQEFRDSPGPKIAEYLEANKQLPIFTSMINAESELTYLNVWRPIFQMLLTFYCEKTKHKKEKLITETIVATKNQRLTSIICEILGVSEKAVWKREPELKDVIQEKPIESYTHFVEMPRFKEETNEAIIEFLTNLFRMLIGDKEDLSNWISFDKKTVGQPSN